MTVRQANPPVERGCALITGASRGIGAAIATGLAADGWPVGVNYRESRKAAEQVVGKIRAAGGEAVALRGDVSMPESADRLCAAVEEELGRPILVLVNNAARATTSLFMQMDEEAWGMTIEANLSAVYRLTRRALRPMLRERFGRIVNISSAAVRRPESGQADYIASKAGLVGLTKAVAVEVAARSVTVNAIEPGLIETKRGAELAESLLEDIPAGRLGRPAEVAACVRFLVSEDAGYMTGSVLTVDGGLTA